MNIDGSGRPYTAKEWEDKLCKGENSLLAQKKRKIAEREYGFHPNHGRAA